MRSLSTLGTLKVSLGIVLAAILSGVLFFGYADAREQAMTFTISPPLFQLHLQPGETWRGGITILNNNTYDITLFAESVPFSPQGESGRPAFMVQGQGISRDPDPTTLAGWITLPQAGIPVSGESTVTIPLEVRIPQDAAPGGHYAAVLIGTRGAEGIDEGPAVSVSSSIASLMFLRVAGDVHEQARIREFSTEKGVYNTAEARFSLRFENQGNVHLRPQGYITIYNMFGKQRGRIEVNAGNDYGNVLPGSIRKFTFVWESDTGSWDIGRYRAEATIGYGNEDKRFATSTVYFWILPIIPFLQVLGAILGTLLIFGWAVRAYVRRVLALERAQHSAAEPSGTEPQAVRQTDEAPVRVSTLERFVIPLQANERIDLRRGRVSHPQSAYDGRTADGVQHSTRQGGIVGFLVTYRYALAFLAFAVAVWFAGKAYFADVLVYERPYEVYEERDAAVLPWDTGVPVE